MEKAVPVIASLRRRYTRPQRAENGRLTNTGRKRVATWTRTATTIAAAFDQTSRT